MAFYNYQLATSVPKTGTLTVNYLAVVGVGTAFLTDLTAGDTITVNSQSLVVSRVISNTLLLVTTAFSGVASGQTITRQRNATGTVHTTGGGTSVVGDGGNLFFSAVVIGDKVVISTESKVVASVTSNILLGITGSWVNAYVAATMKVRHLLTGTVSIADLTYVVGSGTTFTTQYVVGQFVLVGGQSRQVASIIDNLLLTTTTPFASPVSGGGALVQFTNIEDLGIVAPKSSYKPWQKSERIGTGASRGYGAPSAVWHWGYLTVVQRNALRVFCPGKSAAVYVQTRENDDSDAYLKFSGFMFWPDEESKDASRRPDFSVEFMALASYP